jgi:hypothetical protein
MFTPLRSRVARIAVPAVLITGSLAMAHPAGASDFCVGQISCAAPANWMPSLEAALSAAAAGPSSDRIVLSGGDFTAPGVGGWSYNNASGPVEIIGAGVGQTTLKGPAGTHHLLMVVGGPGTTIRDLSIHLPQMALAGTGLMTTGAVERVAVDEQMPQTTYHHGVDLAGGATLADSSVSMDPVPETVGVALSKAGGATVTNSTVSAQHAVISDGGGKIERSWLTGGDDALLSRGGTTTLVNSVIRVNGATGNGIVAVPLADPHPVVNADGLTVLAGFGGAHSGVRAEAYDVAGQTVNISLTNSILRGFGVPVEAVSGGLGTATVGTSWSDYDTTKTHTTGNATISKSNISNVADAGFVNPFSANYHLSPKSPLIDAGDPTTAQGLDMDGNPRVTDGNLDGTARRDIGAYEVPGPLPVDPSPSSGGSDTPPADQAPAGSGGQAAASDTSGRAADTQPPVVSGFRTTKKTFAVGRARTAIAALAHGTTLRYSLSESAKVTITIRRARGAATVGKLTRRGANGANAVKFSGRIGKRALKPGRYVALLTATDASGNHSAAKRVAFRVVTG